MSKEDNRIIINQGTGKVTEVNHIKEGDDIMATSSFNKNFILDSKKAVDSFTKMIANPTRGIKIDRNLTSPEKERQGEIKLKKILSR